MENRHSFVAPGKIKLTVCDFFLVYALIAFHLLASLTVFLLDGVMWGVVGKCGLSVSSGTGDKTAGECQSLKCMSVECIFLTCVLRSFHCISSSMVGIFSDDFLLVTAGELP